MKHFSDNTKKVEHTLNAAIKYLAYQPRTVCEMENYLKKKGTNKNIIGKIIEILLEKQYLDDKTFTKFFVESKIKHKPKSKFAFGYELNRKGVSQGIIDDILEKYDDQDLAFQSVLPKIRQWQNLDTASFKKKVMNFLRYRGFDYTTCMTTLNHFTELKEKS